MMDAVVTAATKNMAANYDDLVCSALGMTQKQVLAIAKTRLSKVSDNGGRDTIMLDGVPVVTIWPLEVSVEEFGHAHKLVSSQKYMLHDSTKESLE